MHKTDAGQYILIANNGFSIANYTVDLNVVCKYILIFALFCFVSQMRERKIHKVFNILNGFHIKHIGKEAVPSSIK